MRSDEIIGVASKTAQRSFSAITNFLARLSGWRFIGLCILMLMAGGIANDLFLSDPGAVIHVTKHKRPKIAAPEVPAIPPMPPIPQAPDATPGAAPAAAPESPAEEKPAEETKSADKQVEIRIGEDGIVIKGSKDLEKVAAAIEKKIDAEIDRAEEEAAAEAKQEIRSRFSFANLALLMIVLMIIVRLVSKSKVKAEERAATAESAADSAALSRQLAEAKLQAMQAQVEPHFLFNTLGAVEHLIETDPPRAAEMQRHLIAYLRSVLPNLRQSDSTLGREADIARNYLEILKFRMESRLSFSLDIPAGLESAAVPPLMLQSLVENAIQHGLEPKPEGGSIAISAAVRDGQLTITVADTGMGMESSAGKRPGGGVGLTSMRERLAALFDGRGKLSIVANSPCGTRATLEFPYAYKQASASTDR